MRHTRLITAAALIVATAFGTHVPRAQGPGLKRTDLMRRDLSAPGREVVQTLVEFAPAAVGARHSHPGEELVYVVEGLLQYALDGKPPVVLQAGDVFFIPAGAVHEVTNLGTEPAAELATYIVEKGKPLLAPAH
jgi:quercetin dioxygenase-like cupin family protein